MTSQPRDNNFLDQAAAFVAEQTKAAYILIGVLSHCRKQVTTRVFLKNGEQLENISYPLADTPCDNVLDHRFCFYPSNVQQTFPLDSELKELNIDSYLGSVFVGDGNEPLGLIALMDEKPIENAAFAEHLILVLSPAIEEELAQHRANL